MTVEELLRFDIESFYLKTPEERLSIAQEYENMMAEIEHRDPCEIRIMPEELAMKDKHLKGYHSGNYIYIRSDYLKGKKSKVPGISHCGFADMIALITHEGRHAWQKYVVEHPEENLVDRNTRLALQLNLSHAGYRSAIGSLSENEMDVLYSEYVAQLVEMDARHFTMTWIRYLAEKCENHDSEGFKEYMGIWTKLRNSEMINAEYILTYFDAKKLKAFEENLKTGMFPGIDTDDVSIFEDAFKLMHSENVLDFISCMPIDVCLDVPDSIDDKIDTNAIKAKTDDMTIKSKIMSIKGTKKLM